MLCARTAGCDIFLLHLIWKIGLDQGRKGSWMLGVKIFLVSLPRNVLSKGERLFRGTRFRHPNSLKSLESLGLPRSLSKNGKELNMHIVYFINFVFLNSIIPTDKISKTSLYTDSRNIRFSVLTFGVDPISPPIMERSWEHINNVWILERMPYKSTVLPVQMIPPAIICLKCYFVGLDPLLHFCAKQVAEFLWFHRYEHESQISSSGWKKSRKWWKALLLKSAIQLCSGIVLNCCQFFPSGNLFKENKHLSLVGFCSHFILLMNRFYKD